MPLNRKAIMRLTGATDFTVLEEIQQLWSGYGQILRIQLDGCDADTVVVKHVAMPEKDQHPRGWNSDRSHLRKVKSYQVESHWYQHYSTQCDSFCRVPECLGVEHDGNNLLLILEDLDAAGFSTRGVHFQTAMIDSGIRWLANFHAKFLHEKPTGLWEKGTYWHLDTRPDEWQAMPEGGLKKSAAKIDQTLSDARYQTLVHGDAKLANFCFSEDWLKIAAVDFQYIGQGCGMKDLAYFIGSCLGEEDCRKLEDLLLDCYFSYLESALSSDIDFKELKAEWRHLYRFAWADFHRFLEGWSPDHWKINNYSKQICDEVVAQIR